MALSSKRSFLYVFNHSLTSSTVSSCHPRTHGEHGFTPILKEIVPHSRHAVTIAASYCRRGGGFGFSLKTVGGCPPTNRLLHSGFRLYPGARLILPLSFFTFHSVQGRQRRGMGRIRCGGYKDQIRGTASPLTPAFSHQGRGSYKTRDGTATNASTPGQSPGHA